MNIGILFPPTKYVGGVFQYALSVADSLINCSDKFQYYIIHYDTENPNRFLNLKSNKVKPICIQPKFTPLIKKILCLFDLVFGNNVFSVRESYAVLRNAKIGFLIIPFPSLFGFRNGIPYIGFTPDLMHKYYPDFPEYPLKERLTRDIVYKYSARYSILNVVDSQQGLEDLHKFFDIPKEKIRVIPSIPPGYVYRYKDMNLKMATKILTKYSLGEKFLFYPAQFWHHKNHIRLIKALKLIKQSYGVKIPLILVGSSKESYKKVINLIKELNMRDQITYLGYVSDKEIVALYKKAVALVFPSLLGPTNIPPLEAMVLGTPVLCSNLFSMPEQVGDAGLLFDPFSVENMAEKIYRIWIDENLRRELIKKGYQKVKNLTLENYAKQWEKIIEEALKKINK